MRFLLPLFFLILFSTSSFAQKYSDTLDFFTENVLFDTDKHNIRPDQKDVLNSLVANIDSIKVIRIELYGHTDSRASDQYNQTLSENRAKKVRKYLKSHGIKKVPIVYTGYGEHDPIEGNESEEGMQANRRTEIKIVHVKTSFKGIFKLPTIKLKVKAVTVDESYFENATLHATLLPKKFYPKDSAILYKEMGMLMDRYMPAPPSKTLVVMDWTRSMYPYGLFLYEWHVNNLETSSLTYLCLFNDGDKKKTKEKFLGRTGGIYFTEPDDIEDVGKLMLKVAKKGKGGDYPENYIEAIIKSIEKYPDADTVVLIADNLACIRDYMLIEQITKPVKVVLCQFEPQLRMINYSFLYLAALTKGALTVMDDEIRDIRMKDDQIRPYPAVDTVIVIPKQKGPLKDVYKRIRKMERKYARKDLPPILIVADQQLSRSKDLGFDNNGVPYTIGYTRCAKHDYRLGSRTRVIAEFTFGQKWKRFWQLRKRQKEWKKRNKNKKTSRKKPKPVAEPTQ